jgi:hypothetical protein
LAGALFFIDEEDGSGQLLLKKYDGECPEYAGLHQSK